MIFPIVRKLTFKKMTSHSLHRVIEEGGLLVILLLLLFGCSQEDTVPKVPTIKTLGVVVQEGGGAVFTGEIVRHDNIDEHGFVIAEDTAFRFPYTIFQNLGKPQTSGYYEFNLTTGLKKDQVYFLRAFIKVNNALYYGETLAFHSNGSRAPEIEAIFPEKGYLEQPVFIRGKNFGQINLHTIISIGHYKTYPSSLTDTLISFNLPAELPAEQFVVKLTVFEKSDEVGYSLHTPEVTGFEPVRGTFRDIVTIYGNHFDTVPERNQVFFGEERALVVGSSRKELKVVVPDYLQASESAIKLFSQMQEVTAKEQFSLIAPIISEVPDCVSSATQVEIKGDFFNPVHSQNRVYFGDAEALVIHGDRNRLLVEVPFGPFPQGKASINIDVAGRRATDERGICVEDPWVMISNTLPFSFYRDIGTFSFSDKAYVIAPPRESGSGKKYLWEFNPVTESWKGTELPFEAAHSGTGLSNGHKGYVYTATESMNFWEFDPDTDRWRERASFPGSRRDHATIFSIDNFIYLGIGNHLNTGEPQLYHDFYRFDPDLNQWKRMADVVLDPYSPRYKVGALIFGNAAYLLGGASTTGHNDVWKYEVGSNTWTKTADAPSDINYASYFAIGNKGYVCNGSGELEGNCWEYDPSLEGFNSFYPVGHYTRFGGFAFVVNGNAYVGGGTASSYHPNSDYEMYMLNR
jgi:hypothetical protein